MTHSHHPHCWYVQAARSFIIWTKEQSRPCHCCFTNHLTLLNPTLNRGLFFFKEGDIKRKNLSRLQHTKCSGTREENAVLCSALWWYNGRRSAELLPAPSAQGTPCPWTGLEYWCHSAGVQELQSGRPQRSTQIHCPLQRHRQKKTTDLSVRPYSPNQCWTRYGWRVLSLKKAKNVYIIWCLGGRRDNALCLFMPFFHTLNLSWRTPQKYCKINFITVK